MVGVDGDGDGARIVVIIARNIVINNSFSNNIVCLRIIEY